MVKCPKCGHEFEVKERCPDCALLARGVTYIGEPPKCPRHRRRYRGCIE